jgi:hypothetical protein
MEASTVTQGGFTPQAAEEENPLGDLALSPQEAGEEAAEAARARGLSEEEVQAARAAAETAARERAEAAETSVASGDPEPPPHEIVVRGRAEAGPKWSGKRPGVCILKLTGGKFAVEGGFRKGERFTFRGEAVVISEGARDRLDRETMIAVDSVQEHEARVLDFDLVDE